MRLVQRLERTFVLMCGKYLKISLFITGYDLYDPMLLNSISLVNLVDDRDENENSYTKSTTYDYSSLPLASTM
jgi:hypothetical protein